MMTTIENNRPDLMQNAVDLFVLDELVRVWNAEQRIYEALNCPAAKTDDLLRDLAGLHERVVALDRTLSQLESADAFPGAIAA
jgi:hypothetical protein